MNFKHLQCFFLGGGGAQIENSIAITELETQPPRANHRNPRANKERLQCLKNVSKTSCFYILRGGHEHVAKLKVT